MLHLSYRLLFLFFIPLITWSQNPSVINYTTKDGLSSNEVYDVFEDKDGFIWMATDNGVTRFDSYKMQLLTKDDGLVDNDIITIDQDSKGRVWFLTYNGEFSYWKDGIVFNKHNDSLLQPISSKSRFICFFEDSKGNLGFGSHQDGLFRRNSIGQWSHFPRLGIDDSIYNIRHAEVKSEVRYLFERDDIVYSVDKIGISKIDDEEGTIDRTFPRKSFGRRFYMARFSYNEKEDVLFASGRNKVYAMSFHNLNIIWELELPKANTINAVELLSDNLLYIATDNGVFSLNKYGNIIQHLLPEKKTSDILIDRENNLWVSTLHNGVFLIRERHILNYKSKPKFTILEMGDSILFGGAESSIDYVQNDTLKAYSFDFTNQSISNQNKIRKLVKDSSNQLWLGTDYGLFKMETNKAKLNLKNGIKTCLFHEEALHVALYNFRAKLNHKTLDSLLVYFKNNTEALGILNIKDTLKEDFCYRQQIFCFSNSLNGVFYCGTKRGVVSNKNFYSPISSKLYDKEVIAIQQTKKNNLWLLEKQGGLYFYITENDSLIKVKGLPMKSGISYSTISLDNKGLVWVGSNQGLFHVKNISGELEVHPTNRNYELIGKAVNDILVKDDTLWLATSEGVTFFPAETVKDTVLPLLHIDSIVVDNKSMNDEEIQHLSSDKNSLSIFLTAISYKNQGRLTLNYQLSGKEKKMGSFSNRNLVLSDLASDTYILEIYATNSNGLKSVVKKVSFTISTIWWKSYQVWLFIIVILSISSIVISKLFLKKRIQETKQSFVDSKERSIMVRSVGDNSEVKILLTELGYVKGAGDYAELHMSKKKVVIRSTMKKILTTLNSPEFMRIHNSYIVNMDKATKFKSDTIKIFEIEIPISRANRERVKNYCKSNMED